MKWSWIPLGLRQYFSLGWGMGRERGLERMIIRENWQFKANRAMSQKFRHVLIVFIWSRQSLLEVSEWFKSPADTWQLRGPITSDPSIESVHVKKSVIFWLTPTVDRSCCTCFYTFSFTLIFLGLSIHTYIYIYIYIYIYLLLYPDLKIFSLIPWSTLSTAGTRLLTLHLFFSFFFFFSS
jgi:hypothetical protein